MPAPRYAAQPVRCGVAAHPGIHHAPAQSGGIQILLQEIGEALARRRAEAGTQTIAERHDHRTRIYWCRSR